MQDLRGKKSVLGIDIGSSFTKIVKIDLAHAQPRLELCELVPTGLLHADFDHVLRDFLKQHKLSGLLAASSIDDPSMKIRKVELPKMPEADLVEAVKWNLRDIVEDDVEKYFVTQSLIREFAEGEIKKLEVVAYAVKKESVLAFQRLLEKVGLHPFFIEPASVSLAATMESCLGTTEDYLAGVHIGHHQTLFYIVGKGIFVFSRPMPGIHVQAYDAEQASFFQKLALEVQKSLDTFKVNFRMEDVKTLYLSGGGSQIPGLLEYLNTNLGLPTKMLNPLEPFGVTETTGDVAAPLFAQAVGLAYITA